MHLAIAINSRHLRVLRTCAIAQPPTNARRRPYKPSLPTRLYSSRGELLFSSCVRASRSWLHVGNLGARQDGC